MKITDLAEIKTDFKNSLYDLKVLQKKYLSVEYMDSTTFNYEQAMKNVSFINQLYSFLLNNILNYKELCLHITNPSTQDLQKVQVYFHQRIASTNSRYLINYNEIEDIFPRSLNEFDTLYSKLEKILSGHLNSSFKKFFEVDDFLQAARNLEVFSRNFYNVESDLPDNYSQTVKSIILCKILYNVLTVFYLPNLIYFLVELSHSSCKSIRTAPINRLAEAWLGKIRMIFSLLRTSWFRRSRRLVLFSRL